MQLRVIVATLVLGASACKKQEAAPAGGGSAAGSGSAGTTQHLVLADAAVQAEVPMTSEAQIDLPFLNGRLVRVSAKVPVGWLRRDEVPAWDPPEHRSLPTWHRSYNITATCDGGCTPAELDARVPTYLDAVKANRIKPKMSGDPVKDEATVAPVTELERGELPQGGMFLLLRVEKPVGSTDPYPDMFDGTCVTRRKDDDFMVVTKITGAPDDEKVWWPLLVHACKATTVESVIPAPP
jgi:hypothetical protein